MVSHRALLLQLARDECECLIVRLHECPSAVADEQQQIGMVDIVQLIGKMDKWKDIPTLFEKIYFSRVPFMLDQFGPGAAMKAYLGMIANGESQKQKPWKHWIWFPPLELQAYPLGRGTT